ncbi:MAG TPA: methyltransferase domain-containing protein [Thermoleophilaceae bacterium]|nr:methyltransferase domain-containing protein [Thermoleophilaceae bacterium]
MAKGDFWASAFGIAYSTYMERPWLSRPIGRVLWGGDSKPYYDAMGAVADIPDGGTIVDCPCGAGPTLRALRPNREVRYVAADLSPAMLRRARKRAQAGRLANIEFIHADATDLPLPSASADLFISFWGLHCYADPQRALAEAARVLTPGGRLVAATFLRGDDSLRQRLLIRPGFGDFGQVATAEELEAGLQTAGLTMNSSSRSGPMLFFQARASTEVDATTQAPA